MTAAPVCMCVCVCVCVRVCVCMEAGGGGESEREHTYGGRAYASPKVSRTVDIITERWVSFGAPLAFALHAQILRNQFVARY